MDDNRRASRRWLLFFALVCVVFMGLMGYVYGISRRVNPVMLDEHGHTPAKP